MVAIVTGNGLGIERTSLYVLGSQGQVGSASLGLFDDNVFVNAATGNLVVQHTDEMLFGVGPDETVTRTYNSLGNYSDATNNWRESFQRRVALSGTLNTTGSTVTLTDWDGSDVVYAWDTGRSLYLSTEGAGAYDVIWKSGTNWYWQDGNSRITDKFDDTTGGILSSSSDVDTKKVTFTYTSGKITRATTQNGEFTDFVYDGSGNLTSMVTSRHLLADGSDTLTSANQMTRVRYGYDSSNRLITVTVDLTPGDNAVTDGATYVTTYTYDGTSKRIASISQTGNSLLSVTYDNTFDGTYRVKTLTQTVSGSVTRLTTLNYTTGSTDVVDSGSYTTTLNYSNNKSLTSIVRPAPVTGGATQTTAFSYNSNGDLLKVTPPSGNNAATTYKDPVGVDGYDANGNMTYVHDGLGNTIRRTYGSNNELLTETRYQLADPDGSGSSLPTVPMTTRYVYDVENHLRYVISPEGRVTEYEYNSTGQRTCSIEYAGDLYPLSLSGLDEAHAPSETDVNTWVTGGSLYGQTLNAVTLTALIRTDYHYDFRGNVDWTKTYEKTVSTTGAGDTAGAVNRTDYIYDQAGNLLQRTITRSGASYSEYFLYDGLNRRTQWTDFSGTVTQTGYDDLNRKVTLTLANGETQATSYDRSIETTQYVITGTGVSTQTTTYKYDVLGRLRAVTDPTGYTTYFLYDHDGRKVAQITADGFVTEYIYSVDSQIVANVSYANPTTYSLSNLISGSGDQSIVELSAVRPSTNTADRWNWNVYDNAHRLIETIDGSGAVVTYTYDGASRLIATRAYANLLTSTQVSGFKTTLPTSLVTPSADAAHDRIVRSFYGDDGQLVGTLDADGSLSEIVYDKAGEKTATIRYATRPSSSLWASGTFSDLKASAGTTGNEITYFVYDGRGALRYTLDALLRPTEYVYDTAGNLLHKTEYATAVSGSGPYDLAYVSGHLTTDATNDRITRFVYNADNQVAYSIDAIGGVSAFAYNSLGSVIRTTRYAAAYSTSSDPSLATMDSWAAGSTIANDANNRTTRTIYDGMNRAVYTVDGENFVTEQQYDAANRVTKTLRYDAFTYTFTDSTAVSSVASAITSAAPAKATTNYAYDVDGRLTDVTDPNGVVTHTAYDGLGQVTDSTEAYGTGDAVTTHFTYDLAGRVQSQIVDYGSGLLNVTTAYTYDGLGRVLTVTQGGVLRTTNAYDAVGNLSSVTTALASGVNAVTSYVYDAFGNRVKVTDPRTNVGYFYYDKLNRLVLQVDPEGYATATDYSFTSSGQTTKVTRFYTKVTGSYSETSKPTPTTNALDEATYVYRDRLDRVSKSVDAETYGITYTLSTFGDRTAITKDIKVGTGAFSATTNYSYDRRGLEITETLPISSVLYDGTTEATSVTNHFKYDARGNCIEKVEGWVNATTKLADSRTTNYTYDKADQLIATTHDAVTITAQNLATTTAGVIPSEFFAYDRRGNLIGSSDASGAITFFYYDHADRKVAQVDPAGTLSTWTYSTAGDSVVQKVYGDALAFGGDPISAVAQVWRLFDLALGRAPTTTEIATWIGKIASHASSTPPTAEGWSGIESYGENIGALEATAVEMLATSEAITHLTPGTSSTYINNLFLGALGRSATSGEITQWQANITAGWTNAGMLTYFSEIASHRNLTAASMVAKAGGGNTLPTPVSSTNCRTTTLTFDRAGRQTGTSIDSLLTGEYSGSSYATTTGTVSTATAYDAAGNVIRQTDGRGNSTYFFYDKAGRKIAQVDGENYLTVYYSSYTSPTTNTIGVSADGNVVAETRFAHKLTTNLGALSDATLATTTVSSLVSALATGTLPDADRTTTFTYDKNGRRLSETRTGLAYSTIDASTGVLTSYTNGTSAITYTYNGLGQVLTRSEATGDAITYEYDLGGRLTTSTTSAFTAVTNVSFSGLNPTVTTASVQRKTINTYDGLNNLTRSSVDVATTGTPARVTKYTYGAGGRLATMIDAASFTRTYGYDTAGRVVKESFSRLQSNGASVSQANATRYDALGRIVWQAAETENTTTHVWTPGDITQTRYDAYGEVTGKGIGGLFQETFEYDAGGRLWRSTAGDGTAKVFIYDKAGNATMMVTSATTDLRGSSITDASAALSASGIVKTITVYDKRGQTTATREPGRIIDATSTTYEIVHATTYNAFGEVSTQVDPRAYDASGALISGVGQDYTTSFSYNTLGKLTMKVSAKVSVTAENGSTNTSATPTENYYYDISGRLIGVEDANSNLSSRTLLAGTGYEGDEAKVLTEFHAGASDTLRGGFVTNAYTVYGDLREIIDTRSTLSDPAKIEIRTYDNMGRLTQINRPVRAAGTPGNPGADMAVIDYYDYDQLGQRLAYYNNQLGSGYKQTTDFDAQGRMIKSVDFAGHTTTYAYTWDSSIGDAGLGDLDGWTKVTTLDSGQTSTDKLDYFQHTVGHTDLGGHVFTMTYDKAGHLATEVGYNSGTGAFSDSTRNLAYSWYNNGLLSHITDNSTVIKYTYYGGVTDSTTITTVNSDFTYDQAGNRLNEKVSAYDTLYSYNFGTGTWGGYQLATRVTQDITATWDRMSRMTNLADNVPDTGTYPTVTNNFTSASYAYDAVGNVRRTQYTYTAVGATSTTSSEYWYKYDTQNRVVTTKGSISGGVISRGTDGVDITYDIAGNRATATSGTSHVESYAYTTDGYLAQVSISDGGASATVRATDVRDALGRITNHKEYDSSGTVVVYERYGITYDAASEVTQDTVMYKQGSDTYVTTTNNSYLSLGGTPDGLASGKWLGGLVTHTTTTTTKNTTTSQPSTDTKTDFVWWEDARQLKLTYDPDTGVSGTFNSTFSYDANGHLSMVYIADGQARTVYYNTDAQGQILSRKEDRGGGPNASTDPQDFYFYFDGLKVGDVSNNGTGETDYATAITQRGQTPGNGHFRNGAVNPILYADFDQSYDPINPNRTSGTSGSYTVHDGDTLQNIAHTLWGDSSLWYLIADANGLTGSDQLVAGQTLIIPAKVHNLHNNTDTFRVYDPNVAIGDVAPNQPAPPKKDGCGGMGMILMVIVAVVVIALIHVPVGGFISNMVGATAANATAATAVTNAAVAAAYGTADAAALAATASAAVSTAGALSAVASVVTGAALGAIGSIASQAFGVMTGIQDKFSWSGVAMAAISGGVGGGLAATGFGGSGAVGAAVRSATGNAITQGLEVATGLQHKFDWTGLAAAAVVGGVSKMTGNWASSAFAGAPTVVPFVVTGIAGAIAGAATRSALDGTDFGDNILAVLPDVIGSTIGGLIMGDISLREPNATVDATMPDARSYEEPERIVAAESISVGDDFMSAEDVVASVQMTPTYTDDGLADMDPRISSPAYHQPPTRMPIHPTDDGAIFEGRPYPGIYRQGNVLHGELVIDFVDTNDPKVKAAVIAQFMKINHVFDDGYGIAINIRAATPAEHFGRSIGGNNVVEVSISKSPETDAPGEYGKFDGRIPGGISINSKTIRYTYPHEIGHVLGLGHTYTDPNSVMFVDQYNYYGHTDRINPYPTQREMHRLVSRY